MSIFRNIMAFIGGIAIVLACVFGFGMINKNFRNFVNDILNTVPAQDYEQTSKENDSLLKQVEELKTSLNTLNSQKQELKTLISNLESKAEVDAETIQQYKDELEVLNTDIDNLKNELAMLNDKFNELSVALEEATITYRDSFARVQYTHFDSSGNPMWTEFSSGTEIGSMHYLGREISQCFENYENVMEAVSKTLEYNLGNAIIEIIDAYEISLNGNDMIWDLPAVENNFNLASDASLETKYMFNGEEMLRDDILTQTNNDSSYQVTVEYEYVIDQDTNLVNSLVCVFDVSLLN